MNVLVLSDNPLSTGLGDGLREFGLLAPLARRHRFDLLCFARPGEVPDPRAPSVFRTVTMLPFPSAVPRSWRRHVLDAVSVREFRARSAAMEAEVARRLRGGDVDVVLDVAANMLLNLPDGRLPVPLVVDSIDEALLRELRDLRAAPWRDKPRMAYRTWMFWRYERKTMARAQANVYVSSIDAATYRRFFPGWPTAVVPNGVDTNIFAPVDTPPDPATLVFEGNMMFGPNIDTAVRLAREILPAVRRMVPQARLILVGRNPAPDVLALAGEDVTVTGTVDDVRPYLARGTVFACPMRLGSGIKNKILQAWAMARPVVASTASLGGLSALDGDNVLVRDATGEFCDAVVELMRNPERACRLGARGRETVECEYTWTRRASQFEAILTETLRTWRAAGGENTVRPPTISVEAPKSTTART